MADLSTMTDEELQAALAQTPALRRDLPKAPAEMSDDELRAAIAGNTVTPIPVPPSDFPARGDIVTPEAPDAFVPSSMAHGVTAIPKFFADQVMRHASIGNPFDMTDIRERIEADRTRGRRVTNLIEDQSQKYAPFMRRQPETGGERVLDAMIQGAMTGPLGPGAKGATMAETGVRVASNMGIGGAAGLSAGGANEMLPEGTPEWLRALVTTTAGMLGGGVAGVAMPWSTAPRTVLEGSVRSKEEAAALVAAALKAKEARAAGIPMNTMDFVEGPPTRLHDIQQSLVTLGEGEQTLRNIHGQPQGIQQEANRFREDTPGRVVAPEEVGRDWQQAATDELVGKKKAATKEFGTTVDQARADSLEAAQADATLSEAQVAAAARGKGALDETAAKVDRMAQNVIDEAQRAANAAKEKTDSTALVQGAGEVVRNAPPVHSLEDLGDRASYVQARRLEMGLPEKQRYTSQELEDIGMSRAAVKKLEAAKKVNQPVTEGTGVVFPSKTIGRDNPGGRWLEEKQKRAEADMANGDKTTMEGKGLRGSPTAYTREAMSLPTDVLKKLKGANDEAPVPGNWKYDNLSESVAKDGFRDDSPILIRVNHKGEAYILEGNNRVAIAARDGVPTVRTEVQWVNGGEEIAGPWTPQQVDTWGKPKIDENSPGVHPFAKDAKAAATDLRNEGETILNTAEHRYETDLSRIEGNEALKPSEIRKAQNRITKMIEENKGKDSIIPDLIHIRDRIGSVTTAKELHNLITDLKNTLPSTKALEPASRNKALTENAIVGPAINGPLKDLRNSAAPAYAKADADYAKAMEELNKTKTTTLLGEIAGPKGAAPDKLAAKGRVDAILDAHDSANMEGSSFRKPTLAAIGRQNPDALANGVATWFDKHLSKIFGESDVAQPNAEAGKQGTRFLGDESNPLNDARIKGTHDIFDSVADAQQMPASDRAAMHRGLDNLRSLFNAGSRAPTRATQVSQQELLDAMGNLGKFEALGIAGIMPGKAILRIVRPMASKKNFAKLDELFSNPDKVHQLIELGKIPKYTYSQRVRIMSLVGALMAENSRQLQTDNNRQSDSEEEPK